MRVRPASIDRRHVLPGLAAFVVALLVALLGLPALAGGLRSSGGVAHIQLLGVNDFHGHLEPGALERDDRGEPAGGAAWLAAYLDRAAATDPRDTIRVHAGDMVGASPLVSSHFHDEPTVKAMNLMRFDVGTVGNHEFDEGGSEMLRLIRGGQRAGPERLKRDQRGALVDTSDPRYAGADFPYLSANVVDRAGRLVLPPYRIVERDGVRIGFIGVTTTTTPLYLLGRFASGYRFLDVSDAVNRYVPELQRRGVQAIVVLAHAGAVRGRGGPAGEIVDETRQMDDAVDVVVAGHTHSLLDDRVGHKLVVEALSYGVAYDRVQLTIDRRSGDVTTASADIPRTWHDGMRPDPRVAALVERYSRRVAPLADRVVGRAARPIAQGELGPVAAAAQRAAAHADVALVNRGNLREGIDAGPITYADLFEVHPYEHRVLVMRLLGSELRALLAGHGRDLYVSGATRHLRAHATYAVAANELLATGPALPSLHGPAGRARAAGTDLEALVAYVGHLRRPLGGAAAGSGEPR